MLAPELLGVLIGSLIPIVGTLIQALITSTRESTEHKRKQELEEKTWLRDQETKEKLFLREAYQNAVHELMAVEAAKVDDHLERPLADSPEFSIVKNAFKSISSIAIRYPSEELERLLGNFASHPHHYASDLRQFIIELARNEKGFFVSNPPGEPQRRKVSRNLYYKEITFRIDHDFRMQKFISGVEIPAQMTFQMPLNEMSESQRRLLLAAFGTPEVLLPSEFLLPLPSVSESKVIQLAGNTWYAKVATDKSDYKPVMSAWEADYTNALDQLKQGL